MMIMMDVGGKDGREMRGNNCARISRLHNTIEWNAGIT